MSSKPHLLILNLFMVHPPDSGAKVVVYNRIVELSRCFRVTFCCLNERPDDEQGARALAAHCEVVLARPRRVRPGRLGRLREQLRNPVPTAFRHDVHEWFASPEMQALLRRRHFDLIELHAACFHHRDLEQAGDARVLVAHNVERDYYVAKLRAALALRAWGELRRALVDTLLVALQERRAVRSCDAVVSLFPPDDVALFTARPPGTVLFNPGGIDLAAYGPERIPPPASATPPVLAFVAALFTESAAQGARAFVEEALPKIRAAHPEATLLLVGDHRGHRSVLDLARLAPGVEIAGRVPDVRPFLARAHVVVVPIVHASGVRYKIMEALAAGKAVVATAKGCEGLGLSPGEDLLVAPSVAAMAPLVVRLLCDATERARLEQRARQVARRFDRTTCIAELAHWYLELLERRAARLGPGGA